MYSSGQEECPENRPTTGDSMSRNCGSVDVAKEENMDGLVPFSGELVPRC